MLRASLYNDKLWKLLPGTERAHGEPHGGGILTYGCPRDTITGTIVRGCLVKLYVRAYFFGNVTLVRDQSHFFESSAYVMEVWIS
jgi:hypothetical protein